MKFKNGKKYINNTPPEIITILHFIEAGKMSKNISHIAFI
jgi:hypothetical protein